MNKYKFASRIIQQGEKRWNGEIMVAGDLYEDDAINEPEDECPPMDWLIERQLKSLPPTQTKG